MHTHTDTDTNLPKPQPTLALPAPHHKLIGHRGVCGLCPENTLPSFAMAKTLGLNWIEFDARLTKCGNWIVMHDATLERTTNGNGPVAATALAYLNTLDAGSWFAPQYLNTKIPLLSEVLEFGKTQSLTLNIEVKPEQFKVRSNQHIERLKQLEQLEQSEQLEQLEQLEQYVKSFVNCITPYIQTTYLQTQYLQGPTVNTPITNNQDGNRALNIEAVNLQAVNILVSSFNIEFLIVLRQRLPLLPIGYLVEDIDATTIQLATLHKFNTIICNALQINADSIKLCNQYGLPAIAYTVNDATLASKLINLGIYGICTDHPELLQPKIAQKLKDISA